LKASFFLSLLLESGYFRSVDVKAGMVEIVFLFNESLQFSFPRLACQPETNHMITLNQT
jgi:hypothetical protein